MIIKAQHWRWFLWIGGIVGTAAALYLFFQAFNAPTGVLTVTAWVVVLAVALTGAAAGVLDRAGVIVFSYSDRDKKRWDYRLAKSLAERERSSGRKFAASYYASFDLTPPESKRS
jgi:hypothetical protein